MKSENEGIRLEGLDGSNPLAFLAALGTLRTLSRLFPAERVTMGWELVDGLWRPTVSCSVAKDGDTLISALAKALSAAVGRASFAIADNTNLPAKAFHEILAGWARDAKSLTDDSARVDADFFAAFGSDAIADENGTMADTALRTMSGAGHQHFLKFFRELVRNTGADHVRRALLLPWNYADEGRGLNLRWDPIDDRRYALRWLDPSTDPNKTMRGANRLAIEALPLLPTMPLTGGLATTAFEGSGARGTYFTWPIWTYPLNESVVRSLLSAVPILRDDRASRASRGVAAMFSAARITIGKFRNFTPATQM